MPKPQTFSFLREINKILVNKGILICRRLNGDYELEKIVTDLGIYDYKNVTRKDRSHFYSEVIIGYKKPKMFYNNWLSSSYNSYIIS